VRASLLAGFALAAALVAPAFARTSAKIADVVGDNPVLACGQAIAIAERGARLPPQLLGAIGIVESGRPDAKGTARPWPWTVNAENTGAFYDTKEAAIAAVQALQARGVRSIDVGCMQVNLMHHPDAFASLEEAFDPRANVAYAARFLQGLFAQLATWPRAAAAYHSQTPDIGADYERRVMAIWPLAPQFPDALLPLLPVPPVPSVYTAEFARQLAGDEVARARLLADMRMPGPRPGKASRGGRGDPGKAETGPRRQLAEWVRPIGAAAAAGGRDRRR